MKSFIISKYGIFESLINVFVFRVVMGNVRIIAMNFDSMLITNTVNELGVELWENVTNLWKYSLFQI